MSLMSDKAQIWLKCVMVMTDIRNNNIDMVDKSLIPGYH